jgi:hypothetical protein
MFRSCRFSVLAVLFLTFATICALPQDAYAQSCPRHKTVMILDPVLTKTKFLRGSAKRLTEWATGHTQNVGAILGLGGGEIGTKFQASFDYTPLEDGRVCVSLDKVKAIFYAYPRMYIASDYKKGSCEYEEILKHEKRHVKALVDAHSTNTERLRVHMGRIAKRIPMFGPVHDSQVPMIKKKLMDYVMQEYLEYQNHQLIALGRAQKKIDHPNEYRGVAARCDDW